MHGGCFSWFSYISPISANRCSQTFCWRVYSGGFWVFADHAADTATKAKFTLVNMRKRNIFIYSASQNYQRVVAWYFLKGNVENNIFGLSPDWWTCTQGPEVKINGSGLRNHNHWFHRFEINGSVGNYPNLYRKRLSWGDALSNWNLVSDLNGEYLTQPYPLWN